MNLQQALASESLQHRVVEELCPCDQSRVSALQLSKKIFAMAESRGEPFTGHTAKTWSEKWLASDEFVLMEIPIMAAAVPNMPFNRNRVLERLHSSADTMEPVLIDLNKRGVGRTPSCGFVPPVIVVDGKHRITAARLQGQETVKAWVGVQAVAKLNLPKAVTLTESGKAPAIPVRPTKIDAAAQLYAGINMTPVPRQDVGDGGSAPTGRAAAAGSPSGSAFIKNRGVKAADASDKKSVQDPSDENYPPDASDKKPGMRYDTAQTRTNTSQMNDVPAKPSNFKIPASPSAQSAGGDAGFRYESKGATRSDNAKKVSDGGSSGMGTGKNKGGATRSELTQVMGGGPGSGRHKGGGESWHDFSKRERQQQEDKRAAFNRDYYRKTDAIERGRQKDSSDVDGAGKKMACNCPGKKMGMHMKGCMAAKGKKKIVGGKVADIKTGGPGSGRRPGGGIGRKQDLAEAKRYKDYLQRKGFISPGTPRLPSEKQRQDVMKVRRKLLNY